MRMQLKGGGDCGSQSDHLHLFCLWCYVGPSPKLGLPRSRIRVRFGWNVLTGEVKWRSKCVKEANWSDAFFLEESKANIFKSKDL